MLGSLLGAGDTTMNKTQSCLALMGLIQQRHRFPNNGGSFQSLLSSFPTFCCGQSEACPGGSQATCWHLEATNLGKNCNYVEKQVLFCPVTPGPCLHGKPLLSCRVGGQDHAPEFHKAASAKTSLHSGQDKVVSCLGG